MSIKAKARCRKCGAQSENVRSIDGDRVALVAHRDRSYYGARCSEGYATVQDAREWIEKEILRRREMIAEIPRRKAAEEDRYKCSIKEIDDSEIEFSKECAALERLVRKYR